MRLLVVGGGKAGKSLAMDRAEAGWSVAMVEWDKIGGTCLSILGGGYVGCEFASMFALFGSHMTLVQGRDQSRWTTTRASAP